jgi:hypothetical protein
VYIYDISDERVRIFEGGNTYLRTEPLGNLEISEHLQDMIQFTDGVTGASGNFYFQAILEPKIPNERREVYVRRIDLNNGEIKTMSLPLRAGFNGMLAAENAVLLPVMQRTEDSIAYRKVAF